MSDFDDKKSAKPRRPGLEETYGQPTDEALLAISIGADPALCANGIHTRQSSSAARLADVGGLTNRVHLSKGDATEASVTCQDNFQ
jgi:hypothetical protein